MWHNHTGPHTWWYRHNYTVQLSHIRSTVSDVVSPSPKGGGVRLAPLLNPPLGSRGVWGRRWFFCSFGHDVEINYPKPGYNSYMLKLTVWNALSFAGKKLNRILGTCGSTVFLFHKWQKKKQLYIRISQFHVKDNLHLQTEPSCVGSLF